jgi:hypothetical protein
MPDADGRWLLMEAELIEADFFLGMIRRGAGLCGRCGKLLARTLLTCRVELATASQAYKTIWRIAKRQSLNGDSEANCSYGP